MYILCYMESVTLDVYAYWLNDLADMINGRCKHMISPTFHVAQYIHYVLVNAMGSI